MAALLIVALTPTAGASGSAGSVPGRTAGAPVTTKSGKLTLKVDPVTGIDPVGGTITVSGSGFDPTSTLYVAVCAADGKAPAQLTGCIGGTIPDANKTQAWGYVTPDGSAPPNGGAVTDRWAHDGSFSLGLVLPAATSNGPDCAKVACAVYTRTSAGDAGRLSVPVAFGAATSSAATPTTAISSTPNSSTASSSTPISPTTTSSTVSSTITSIPVPSTVEPKSIKSESVATGGLQEVMFAGFAAGEQVSVTLFSKPISLPGVTADPDGNVKIDFTVPKDLPPGTHILQAVGATSRTIGRARFTVTLPPVTSSTPTPSSTVSSTRSSSAPSTTSSPPATSSASPAVSSIPVTTPVTTSIAAPVASKPKPVWPWYLLGMIVLISFIIGIVAFARRRSRLADENAERLWVLDEAASEEQLRAEQALLAANAEPPTTNLHQFRGPDQPSVSPPGYRPDAHGLLSGRENLDDPGLMSGQGYVPPPSEQRTAYIPPVRPASDRPPSTTTGPAGHGPHGPDGSDGPDGPYDPEAGPATTHWTSPADDDDPSRRGRHEL